MTCTSYCKKIEEIFDAIIHLAGEVLPENRQELNEYISVVWDRIMTWVRSISREEGTEELRSKFESYLIVEEVKLHRNLEEVLYDIDSYDTVKLIAGKGRVETVIPQAPLLFFQHTDICAVPLPNAIPCTEARLGKDHSCSQTRPFSIRAVRRHRNGPVHQ